MPEKCKWGFTKKGLGKHCKRKSLLSKRRILSSSWCKYGKVRNSTKCRRQPCKYGINDDGDCIRMYRNKSGTGELHQHGLAAAAVIARARRRTRNMPLLLANEPYNA